MPDSPASLVGLRKNEDFIVGSEKVTFHNIGKLDDVLRRSVAQTMVRVPFLRSSLCAQLGRG